MSTDDNTFTDENDIEDFSSFEKYYGFDDEEVENNDDEPRELYFR